MALPSFDKAFSFPYIVRDSARLGRARTEQSGGLTR